MANTQPEIAPSLSDMLAIEKHLRTPFQTQLGEGEVREYQDTIDVLTRLTALAGQHIDNLTAALEAAGSRDAASLKDAVADVGGIVAGMIDKVRRGKTSKALCDDVAALGFAIAGYAELLTAANALAAANVAALAQRHLEDYAGLLVELTECIAAVTIRELPGVTPEAAIAAAALSRESIHQAWQTHTPLSS